MPSLVVRAIARCRQLKAGSSTLRSITTSAAPRTRPQTALPPAISSPNARPSLNLPSRHRTYATESSQKNLCPSCSQPLATTLPACNNCSYIAPIPISNQPYQLYEILDVPSSPNPFIVDEKGLVAKFRRSQVACHPDSWASRGSEKQSIAQELSSRVNTAYKTLSNQLLRIEYILECNGYEVTEEDKTDDIAFLTEIMDEREALEEGADLDTLQQIEAENEARLQGVVDDIASNVAEKDWETAKANAIKLRYLNGIRRAVKQKLEDH